MDVATWGRTDTMKKMMLATGTHPHIKTPATNSGVPLLLADGKAASRDWSITQGKKTPRRKTVKNRWNDGSFRW